MTASPAAILLVGLPPLVAAGLGVALPGAALRAVPAAEATAEVRNGGVELAIVDPYEPAFDAGLRLCREMKAGPAAPYTMALCDPRRPDDILQCLLAGVDSFVGARERPERVAAAVAATLAGHREWLLGGRPDQGRVPAGELTPRELDVLWLVRDGRTNRQIAASLVISPYTVKNHVAAILRKLGADRRGELRHGNGWGWGFGSPGLGGPG